MTLHGPVSKEQLYKIQEVLRHRSQYRDRIKPEDHPVKGEYATAFNKFCPKKVEVNKATVKEAIKYGQFLKKSEEDIAEAIDIYVMYDKDSLLSLWTYMTGFPLTQGIAGEMPRQVYSGRVSIA